MMYQNKFIAAVKHNNQILREYKDTVRIPFGSEYKIYLKNLNTVRAQFRVFIDGTEAVDWVILQPNTGIDLERYLHGNLNQGNRFKFIERTENIEKHRSVKAEDGIIKVEYKFEIPILNDYKVWRLPTQTPWVPNKGKTFLGNSWDVTHSTTPNDGHYTDCGQNGILRGMKVQASNMIGGMSVGETSCYVSNVNDAGITVPGSVSNQKFYTASDFDCGPSEVIILKLIGELNEVKVVKPITVKLKPKCKYCGRVNKATNKFCAECGAALMVL